MIELLAATAIALHQGAQPDPKLDWWRDARFGMFIHWGLYAVPAGSWEDKGTGHAEWIRTTAQIPLETYDKFVHEFNPLNFDADAWCEMASDAGMGYVVITSKHHDGFCLFDSQHTDFDIMSTPFKRDIMKELAEAAPKHDVRMSWYHSIMDWHHPDYLPRRGWEKQRADDGADMKRYRNYLHNQVTELLTNYGPVGIMWFDGEWESTWRGDYGRELYELCVELQPEVIVNNRLGARGGMEGITGVEGFVGGYAGDYMTPEQEIPDAVGKGIDWETCMTMNDRWGYNLLDKNFKSTTDLLQKLSDIVSKNGNFLLNIGPKPDGTFPEESVQRLSEIGDWMDVNAKAIHGTVGSPFKELEWGRATQKFHKDSTTLYMHVFDWPSSGSLIIPGLAGEVLSARVLGGDDVPFTMEAGKVRLDIPRAKPNKHIGVIAVEVQGKPVIFEEPTISAPVTEFVQDVEVTLDVGSEGLEIKYWIVLKRNELALDNFMVSFTYDGPFIVSESATVYAQCFDGEIPVSSMVSKEFIKVTPWKPSHRTAREGICKQTYNGTWDTIPDFSKLDVVSTVEGTVIKCADKEFIGEVYTGLLQVQNSGTIVFALASDDGSRLSIDGKVVVDNDGLHGDRGKRGYAPLARGNHEFVLEWFNKSGGATLELQIGKLGGPLQRVTDRLIVE
ncbi:MAG: alpha-L-fucosidase [Planctomycetes bacterium]|nr:alpha-L-fucosidase [Planctomycetota bacterium]